MSHANFNAILRPKVQGSWNLHSLLPSTMDFFILLASYAGIIGSYAQTNYAAGNTYQDALARHRLARGARAVSIDLANVRSVGYLAERDELATALRTEAFVGIEEAEFLALMDRCCDPNLQLTQANCQIVTGVEPAKRLRKKGIPEPLYMNRRFFSHLYALDYNDPSSSSSHNQPGQPSSSDPAEEDLRALLLSLSSNNPSSSSSPSNPSSSTTNTSPSSSAEDIITAALRAKIGSMMDLDPADMDPAAPLHRFGVDSLAAIEIRTWLARKVGADVKVFEIVGGGEGGSVRGLGALAAGRLGV